MAGARAILTAPPYQTPGQAKMAKLRAMRGGDTTKAALAAARLKSTTDLVENLVERKKGMVTVRDLKALQQVTGENPTRLQTILAEAKEKFAAAAVDYVNLHKQATEMAVANGDAKSLDVATRAAQWAIEKIAHKGDRIIDKEAVSSNSGTKIMIGLQLGGKNPMVVETEPVVDAE